MDLQLQEYVRSVRAQGASDAQIRETLIKEGWNSAAIDEVLGTSAMPSAASPSIPTAPKGGKLSGTFTLLGKAFATLREHASLIFGYAIISPVLSFIGSLLMSQLAPDVKGAGQLGGYMIGVLIYWILYVVVTGAAMISMLEVIGGVNVTASFGGRFMHAVRRVHSWFFLSLIMGATVMGGLILLIIPGVYLGIMFSFYQQTFVLEGRRGYAALIASKKYVEGYGHSVLWRALCAFIVVILPALVIMVVLSVASAPNNAIASQLSGSLFTLFLVPLFASFSTHIFLELRNMRGQVPDTSTHSGKWKYILLGLVGILIIPAILFGVVFASLNTARGKAAEASRRANMNGIKIQVLLYTEQFDRLPTTLQAAFDASCGGLGTQGSGNTPTSKCPEPLDPDTKAPYRYTVSANGDSYTICPSSPKSEVPCQTEEFPEYSPEGI